MSLDKDPYQIETEYNNLLNERKDWMVGKQHSELNRDNFELKMQSKYAYLYVSSKRIFDKCMQGELDNKHNKGKLDMMINYLKQIHDNNRSQADVEKEFGQILADEYVNPIVNKIESEKKK